MAIKLDEAEAGVQVEQEHTPNKGQALKIGLTHNLEDKNYYKKLDIMEHTPLSRLQELRKCYAAKSLQKGLPKRGNVEQIKQTSPFQEDTGAEDKTRRISGTTAVRTSPEDIKQQQKRNTSIRFKY